VVQFYCRIKVNFVFEPGETPLATFDQSEYQVRFEWGERGVGELAPKSDFVIIVDVLSFSTCVDVATTQGATVFPFGWKDQSAAVYAKSRDALLVNRRGQGTFSLSPPSLANLPRDSRIVLPSPNGSTLTLVASDHSRVLCGCLRNCRSVANFVNREGGSVTVVACGERWMPGDTLRPAMEDQLGAGAIIQKLKGTKSPEAGSAEATFRACENVLLETLSACSSGKELTEKGYGEDVTCAGQIDSSQSQPLLSGEAYIDQSEVL
jgi:2-phosphosulfolactate phosphatase